MKAFLIFYKGKVEDQSLSAFKENLVDNIIRVTTRGRYSHCEIAVPTNTGDYTCYTSSPRDGGVRKKTMKLSKDKWDFLPITVDLQQLEQFYEQTKERKYDLAGAVGIVLNTKQNPNKYFCSEWCFNALFNSDDGWRFSPNTLYALISSINRNL